MAPALRPEGDDGFGRLTRCQAPDRFRIGPLLDRFGQGPEPHPQMVGRQPPHVLDCVRQVGCLARDQCARAGSR